MLTHAIVSLLQLVYQISEHLHAKTWKVGTKNCKYFNALNALNALTGFMLMNRNMINVGLFSA